MVLQECTNSHGHSLSNYFNISTDQINRRMRISEKHLTARGVTVDGLADIESLQESSDHEYKQLDFDISDEENSWLAAPTTAEEYAVLAVRLGRESTLRSAYIAKRQHGIEDAIEQSRSPFYSQGSQILHFLKILHNTYFAELENNSL